MYKLACTTRHNDIRMVRDVSGQIFFKLLFYRSPTAVDELAVRPITQFPITLDDEVRVCVCTPYIYVTNTLYISVSSSRPSCCFL